MRFILGFLVVLFLQSCTYFSSSQKEKNSVLDTTVIDFYRVDSYPTFDNCTELIDKKEKEFCFRETIYQKVGQELDKIQLKSNDTIDEAILVQLKISSQGFFSVDSIISSTTIKINFPELDSVILKSIETLPKVFPAIKRGIPVTTVYELPIQLN